MKAKLPLASLSFYELDDKIIELMTRKLCATSSNNSKHFDVNSFGRLNFSVFSECLSNPQNGKCVGLFA